jgi:hypothetical protein
LLLSACDKEKVIPSNDLFAEIKSFISNHFSDNSIIQVIRDRDGLTITHDVMLSENINLEFNRKNEIIEIDGLTELPSSVIPEKLRQYVINNYPSNLIRVC